MKLSTNLSPTQTAENVAPSGSTVAASQRIAGLPGFTGALPVKQGAVISGNTKLTDSEKKMWEAAGWKPGQPIPAHMADHVEAERRRIMAEAKNALAGSPDSKPFKAPEEVSFGDLSPERQRMLINEVKTAQARLVDPKAYEATKTDEGPVLEVYDSRKNKTQQVIEKQNLPTLADLQRITVEGAKRLASPDVAAPAPEDKKESAPVNEPDNVAGGVPAQTHCQHCGWPLSNTDIHASEEDKYIFLQSILGQVRFEKEYQLFGGKMKVVFRTLSTAESDLVYRQMAIDMKNGKVDSGADYWFYLMTYRLACGLAKIDTEKTGPIVVPEIKEFNGAKPSDNDTVLPVIARHILDFAVPLESTRRVLINQFARFQRTVEHLEARMDDSDFWKAIEARG